MPRIAAEPHRIPDPAAPPGPGGRRISRRWWLATAIGCAVAVLGGLRFTAQPAADHPFTRPSGRGPLVIAHRGGAGLWPENTLYAFAHAVSLGVDMLEMDLRRTADGVPVLMHDPTVDRTTDGTGRVAALPLDRLKRLDAGYDWTNDGGRTFPFRGRGIGVPTLDEVLAAFPETRLDIELKDPDPALAEALCRAIQRFEAADRVLVASFHARSLQAFRRSCPTVARSAGSGQVRLFFLLHKAFLSALYSPDDHVLQVPLTYRGIRVLTPRFLADARRRNLKVYVWTVNAPAQLQQLREWGVDGILTDFPDLPGKGPRG